MAPFIAAAATIYVAGATGTLLFNFSMIVGPVKYPLVVLRNALLWPRYLPLLLSAPRR